MACSSGARTLKLLIAYDGTNFVGWQRQRAGVSIQGLLEEALARIEGGPVHVAGAGRTDAGVHATAQVASVRLTSPIRTDTLVRALNAVMPATVRILSVDAVAPHFHARFSATGKTYHYRILHGAVASPFAYRYAWHVPRALDVPGMARAARLLEGTHDFRAFRSTGSEARTSVRTITSSQLHEAATADDRRHPGSVPIAPAPAGLLTYTVTGNGFLRHMVRAIVGTLVEIGRGRADASLIENLLNGSGRAAAGPTAPAAGLCLEAVHYGDF